MEFLSLATRQIAPSFQNSNLFIVKMKRQAQRVITLVFVNGQDKLLVPAGSGRMSIPFITPQRGESTQGVALNYIRRHSLLEGGQASFKHLDHGVCVVSLIRHSTALKVNCDKAVSAYKSIKVPGTETTILSVLIQGGVIRGEQVA